MAPLKNISESKGNSKEEYLHINISKRKINSKINVIKYRDKDTRQMIMFIPSLEITGYGATEKKAFEMLKFSLDDFCKFLINLPPQKIPNELHKLGWVHSKIKNKEYSKAYIDVAGNLHNFNAVADKVEVEQLTF